MKYIEKSKEYSVCTVKHCSLILKEYNTPIKMTKIKLRPFGRFYHQIYRFLVIGSYINVWVWRINYPKMGLKSSKILGPLVIMKSYRYPNICNTL